MHLSSVYFRIYSISTAPTIHKANLKFVHRNPGNKHVIARLGNFKVRSNILKNQFQLSQELNGNVRLSGLVHAFAGRGRLQYVAIKYTLIERFLSTFCGEVGLVLICKEVMTLVVMVYMIYFATFQGRVI